jgi:hypothetical protein
MTTTIPLLKSQTSTNISNSRRIKNISTSQNPSSDSSLHVAQSGTLFDHLCAYVELPATFNGHKADRSDTVKLLEQKVSTFEAISSSSPSVP